MTGLLVLFYDVETTGLPLWNEPSDNPRQPHIVELAAILRNRDGSIRMPIHSLIKPEGWIIPPGMTLIHGISQERALAEGNPAAEVMRKFMALWKGATVRVAHK